MKRSKNIPYILWLKRYFDTGTGLTNYFRWILYAVGLSSQDLKLTMLVAIGYGIISLILGWWWVEKGWMEMEMEIGNILNRFQREVRAKIKKLK